MADVVAVIISGFEIFHRALAAGYCDSCAAFIGLGIKGNNRTCLGCSCCMSTTAGADVSSTCTDYSYITLQFFFTAVFQFFHIFRETCVNRLICPCKFVTAVHYHLDFFFGQRTIEIHHILSFRQMESHIAVAEQTHNHTRKHMFACVLLHKVKASVPVNCTADVCIGRDFTICIMDDYFTFFTYIGNIYRAFTPGNNTVIPWLTATFRVKCSSVKYNCPAFFIFCAGNNLCSKLLHKAVLIK